MSTREVAPSVRDDTTALGFWLYLMTDCVLFATLFAVYAVLHHNLNGGPAAAELFSLPYALAETIILLTSSFTAGLALLAARTGNRRVTLTLLLVTSALGVAFLGLELHEFGRLVADGNGAARSGFLSAFFVLVGTHGLHITAGLVWMSILALRLVRSGLGRINLRRLGLMTLFWHFLDLIWIFIFSLVYLGGAVKL